MIAATAVAAFAALPAMAEDGDKIVVGVSTDTATTVFRQVELMGLYDMAEENGDMEIIELNADNDTTTQATQFKSLIDQGVDVIVCCAIDQDAILSSYDYALSKGVPIINYDRKVEHEGVAFTAMYDSYSDAKQLAEYLISVDDGEEHTIFLTVGSLADPNGIARREGFEETIEASGHDNLKITEIMTDWDVDTCLTNMQNALQVEGQNSFREYFCGMLRPVLMLLTQNLVEEGRKKEFYIAFLCEGVLGELVYWLREGSKITPEEFVEDLHDISLGLARKIIAEEAGTQNEIPLFQNKKV